MKAELLYRTKVEVVTEWAKRVIVAMDLFRLPSEVPGCPEGYRFSWIAFDVNEPGARILCDAHPPKGPHWHVDGDTIGIPFEWKSLNNAEAFFLEKIAERFGVLRTS